VSSRCTEEWRLAPSILTSALDGSEWRASRTCLFTTMERAPGTLWIGGWVGHRAGLDAVSYSRCESSLSSSAASHHLARLYTEWAIPAPFWIPSRSFYCHVFHWLRRGFGLVNRFIGSSLVVITISSYTLKIAVTIVHMTSHTKSSNSSSGHTAVPLELQNSSEVNSHSRMLSYPLGTDHTQKTQFYCCVAQTAQKTSHAIHISPVHSRWMLPSNEL
jgi:hypothetical protein